MNYQGPLEGTAPSFGLHTVCSSFHEMGIRSFHCFPNVTADDGTDSIVWHAVQLGTPGAVAYRPMRDSIEGFRTRGRRHSFLSNDSDCSKLEDAYVPEEFSKENLRVSFQNAFMSEVSDIDSLFWGQSFSYPIEVKEKSVAHDPALGEYFGLDIGPYVKLSFFAAKRENFRSIFVVREVDNTDNRSFVNWWYVPFGVLAQYASWNARAGGTGMTGGASTTVRIPKHVFKVLDESALKSL